MLKRGFFYFLNPSLTVEIFSLRTPTMVEYHRRVQYIIESSDKSKLVRVMEGKEKDSKKKKTLKLVYFSISLSRPINTNENEWFPPLNEIDQKTSYFAPPKSPTLSTNESQSPIPIITSTPPTLTLSKETDPLNLRTTVSSSALTPRVSLARKGKMKGLKLNYEVWRAYLSILFFPFRKLHSRRRSVKIIQVR